MADFGAEISKANNFELTTPSGTVGAVKVVLDKNWKGKFTPGILKRMDAVGKAMVAEAREIAPQSGQDHPDGSPALVDSIFYKVVQGRSAGGTFGNPQIIFGASAPYALPVEFGHHTHDGGFVEAQPFLRVVAFKKRRIG